MEPRDGVNEYLRQLYGLDEAGQVLSPVPARPTFAPGLIEQGERLVAEELPLASLATGQEIPSSASPRDVAEIEAAAWRSRAGVAPAPTMEAPAFPEFEPKSYMETLKQAQEQDRAVAAGAGLIGGAEQIARILSRGMYQPTGLPAAPSAVSELERRRAAVTDFLTQQRAAAREAADAEYKRSLIARMAQPRAVVGKTEEELRLLTERAETEQAKQEELAKKTELLGQPKPGRAGAVKKEKPLARDYAGERKADYERRLREGVPTGYELRPGAQPTTKQREEAAKLTVSNDIVKESVSDVRALLATPNAVANPQTRDLLKQQCQFIKTQLRVLEDLGVPSGPDAQILDQLIGDPASVTGEVLNTTVKKLDALTKYVNTRVQTTAYRYGLQPSAPPQQSDRMPAMVRVKRKSDGRIVEVPSTSIDSLLKSNAIEVIP